MPSEKRDKDSNEETGFNPVPPRIALAFENEEHDDFLLPHVSKESHYCDDSVFIAGWYWTVRQSKSWISMETDGWEVIANRERQNDQQWALKTENSKTIKDYSGYKHDAGSLSTIDRPLDSIGDVWRKISERISNLQNEYRQPSPCAPRHADISSQVERFAEENNWEVIPHVGCYESEEYTVTVRPTSSKWRIGIYDGQTEATCTFEDSEAATRYLEAVFTEPAAMIPVFYPL